MSEILKFTLGAKEYTVTSVPSIDDTGLGRTYSSLGEIKISDRLYGNDIPADAKEQTLYHEVTHAILDDMGRYDLSKDEAFVSGFSTLLHQFIVTSREYQKSKPKE